MEVDEGYFYLLEERCSELESKLGELHDLRAALVESNLLLNYLSILMVRSSRELQEARTSQGTEHDFDFMLDCKMTDFNDFLESGKFVMGGADLGKRTDIHRIIKKKLPAISNCIDSYLDAALGRKKK